MKILEVDSMVNFETIVDNMVNFLEKSQLLQDLGSATLSTVDFVGTFLRFWGHFVRILPLSPEIDEPNLWKIDSWLVATVAIFFEISTVDSMVNFWKHSRQYGQLLKA